MIEYLIIGILSIFGIIAIICAYLMNKKLNNDAEKQYNSYKIARKKISTISKSESKVDGDIDDEVDDFIDSMPQWLLSVMEGAGVDIEKLYYQDAQELSKVKAILEKIPINQQHQAKSDLNSGLIG